MQTRPRNERPHLPLWARSVVLRGHLDCADNAGVQGGEIVGWDPPDLADLVPVQERPQDLESGDVAWSLVTVARSHMTFPRKRTLMAAGSIAVRSAVPGGRGARLKSECGR
jgi:hypothetical protein